ncbi:MAG: FAD-dependent oxidoreductase [Candidatus Doudnabacteria bacterium]|nr:FAD-dependent oxidoreductase [Candidatus Doudnabacteria bacterium]
MQTFSPEITKIEKLTSNILELSMVIEGGEFLTFIPGQFVQFIIGDKVFRSYSIISLPEELPLLKFCIKLEDGGVGSEYVRLLKVGDSVPMRGPTGKFVVGEAQESAVFVANGVGVAPFYSMIPNVLTKNPEAQASLIFGVRTESDIFYHKFFTSLAENHSNFNFVQALSQPQSEWHGYTGRVTKYIEENYHELSNSTFYLCGSLGMVQDVRAILMQNGHPTDKIKLEIFT